MSELRLSIISNDRLAMNTEFNKNPGEYSVRLNWPCGIDNRVFYSILLLNCVLHIFCISKNYNDVIYICEFINIIIYV